jgi:hypothetical protein
MAACTLSPPNARQRNPCTGRILRIYRWLSETYSGAGVAITPLALLVGVLLIFIPVTSGNPQNSPSESRGDNGLAVEAEISGPRQIAVDEKGNLYVYQSAFEYKGIQRRAQRGAIRKIDSATHKITTLAVGCEPRPQLPPVRGLCFGLVTHLVASSSRLLLSDLDSDMLWSLELASRRLSAIAGNGGREPAGDGGLATQAGIFAPRGFAVDDSGNIFMCDPSRRSIRRVDAGTGTISTVAGNGGAAAGAQLITPMNVAIDRDRNLYVADAAAFRILRVDATTGIIETIAGSGQNGFRGEGGPAKAASLDVVGDVASDSAGNVYFMTGWRICRIDRRTGILSTLAGTGEAGFSGDGGSATQARIGAYAFAMDGNGNLFTAEYEANRIRRVDAKTGIITTVGGNGFPQRAPTPVY